MVLDAMPLLVGGHMRIILPLRRNVLFPELFERDDGESMSFGDVDHPNPN
jgi:hypothetical protein